MKRIPLPLSAESNDALYGSWRKFALIPETGSCYYYNKADLLYRITQLHNDPWLSTKYLKNIRIFVIDADTILDDEESGNWEQALKMVRKGQTHTLILILGMDRYLQTGNASIFHFLMRRQIELETVSMLLFFLMDCTHPSYRHVFDTASVWTRNVLRYPLHSSADTRTYLKHQAAMWHVKLKPETLETIAQHTAGGNFFLPKEALRYLREHPNCSHTDLFHHHEMTMRLDIMWRGLLSSEQEVMKKVLAGTQVTDPVEKHSLSFLTDTGWINTISGRNIIAIPLLSEFISHMQPKIRIQYQKPGTILLNGVAVNAALSQSDQKLLRAFVQSDGAVLSRDAIARILSGDNDEYSDWAIDKALSRLRKSLGALNIPPGIIHTVHGKGFRIVL